MTSNLKEKAVTSDSVQVSDQEILKHLADFINIKPTIKPTKYNLKAETSSMINGQFADTKSVMSFNSYKGIDNPTKMC
jgi:hypothetical protein